MTQTTPSTQQIGVKFQPLIYHVVARRLSRIKRHVFRIKLARWIGSLAEVVENVFDWLLEKLNSLMLLPSLMAVWVAPQHFFRRLPLIRRAHHSWYVKPGFFLLHLAGVTLAITFFVYPRIPRIAAFGSFLGSYVPAELAHPGTTKHLLLAKGLLLSFCFLAPLWIVPVSAVTLGARRLIQDAWRNAADVQTTYQLSKPWHEYPVFLIPLSRESYKLLDWNRYISALSYFGLSGFLMLHVVGLLAAISYVALKYFLWGIGGLHYLPLFVLVPFLLAPTIFAEWLVVRPYVELLRSSRKLPTTGMYFSDDEEVRFAVAELIAELSDLIRLNVYLAEFGKDRYPTTEERKAVLETDRKQRLTDISETARALHRAWSDLSNLWRTQRFDICDAAPHLQSVFIEERRKAFLRVVDLKSLEDLLTRADLTAVDAFPITSVIHDVNIHLG